MIPGFIQVSGADFYAKYWRKIKATVEAVESNLKANNKLRKAGLPTPPLVVHWGTIDAATKEKTILAITRSSAGNADEHWISPSICDG